MPLISSVTARSPALIDAFSEYFVATSVSVSNAGACYQQTNVTASITPLGEDLLSLLRLILFDTPLSIVPFWLPSLQRALAGLLTVGG